MPKINFEMKAYIQLGKNYMKLSDVIWDEFFMYRKNMKIESTSNPPAHDE